jgi:3-hydroxyisobutyrate dehydrogenase
MRVGFIGLGSQGAPMAQRIAEDGFPLTVWARRREALDAFRDGAAIAASPAELGAASDLVCICVVSDDDVREVLTSDDGVLAGLEPGGIVAIHSTINPATCVEVAEHAKRRRVALVDAPVSGGGAAATTRELLVMAGGAPEDIERCRPVFETFSASVLYLGELGSGQTAKLLNNLVLTAQFALAVETFSFGEALGVDPTALAAVLAGGSGGSRAAAILAASSFNLNGLRTASGLLHKDIALVLALAQSRAVDSPELLTMLANRTLAELDAPANADQSRRTATHPSAAF